MPYTTPQAAKILQIPMRKILSYIERGYVRPSLRDASGHGSSRQWDLWDLNRIHLIRKCENFGLSVPRLRALGQALVQPSTYSLAVVGECGELEPAEFPLRAPCLVLDFEAVRAEVQEMIDSAGL